MGTLRQGDTTDITFELSQSLGDMDMKVGIYNTSGKGLYETYVSDGIIQKVDNTHYTLRIPWEITKKFIGETTLRVALFTSDKQMVNAGENWVSITWDKEPVTKELK